MNKEELLANIRKIIGNKKFTFSDAYIKQCKSTPTIGDDERNYCALTKKYLFIDCWGCYSYSEEEKEWGWYFMRYPICYRFGDGENIHKVKLEDMFTKDLQKLYDDIVFYLWWEKDIHLTTIEKELADCKKYVNMLEKITNQ
jgi:hypothetical protein